MIRALAIAAIGLLPVAAASAQEPAAPIPLIPSAPPRSIEAAPLPGPAMPAPPSPAPGAETAPPPAPGGSLTPVPKPEATARIFCHQPVAVRLADRDSVPERYRGFLGVWSDATWTPQLCAALVVENVAPDGTATILYAFGPIGSGARGPGGVLNGTGIVQDGELRFQNSDGSQFAFRPVYADLEGRLTTPQGQSYKAVFKKTP
ncbi:MAG: hypothetical protein AB7H71_03850 [Alphaproteobacteria bacterium]